MIDDNQLFKSAHAAMVFAFNYKNSTFLYRCDERYGNSFFKYESAIELVNEVKNELNYDLTFFYENKLYDGLLFG